MRYKFGILYAGNEGRLLGTDSVDAAGVVKRSQTSTYVTDEEVASMPFPAAWGDWTGAGDAGLALKNRPIRQSTTVQDGVTFDNVVSAFDAFARPATVIKSNSQGYSRTEQTTYQDNLANWKLGQVKSVSKTAPGATVVMSQTEYNAADMPWRTYSFGVLEQTLTYNPDGTLATAKDGKGNTTTLSNWKRGLPQSVLFSDGTTQSVNVDDNGWIRSITDENTYVTTFDYDAMGRTKSVTYPAGDSTNWNKKTFEFVKVPAEEMGIPAGHWRHKVVEGNHEKTTFFDALWQPLVVAEADMSNLAETYRIVVNGFDTRGRQTLSSYPRNPYTEGQWGPWIGTHTTYDVLDRVIRVDQDSELGTLTTDTVYLPGLQVQVTNPRRQPTTTTFMAYDQPTQDWPVAIVQPEGVYTDIARDVFGKPLSIKRRNSGSTTAVTRQLVYDGYERLCKAIEPETGATATSYDAAGNVDWTAAGLSLTDPANCNASEAYSSGRRVQRSYDARNRLSTLGFPDGNGNQSWEYWADGLVKRITTYNDGVGRHE
jgi:YD repeat-containing protein